MSDAIFHISNDIDILRRSEGEFDVETFVAESVDGIRLVLGYTACFASTTCSSSTMLFSGWSFLLPTHATGRDCWRGSHNVWNEAVGIFAWCCLIA